MIYKTFYSVIKIRKYLAISIYEIFSRSFISRMTVPVFDTFLSVVFSFALKSRRAPLKGLLLISLDIVHVMS